MNITVIGMIKNSADIIESFIRANGLYADQFVLIDNCCSDNTISILNNLINEGYKIDIIKDTENAYLQSMKMNILIRKVIASYNTDWIIPLDDDEILFDQNGKNVKDVISQWNNEIGYYIPWRIYIPTEEDNNTEVSVPLRQQFYFSEKLPVEFKVAFSKKIAADDSFRITQGNHDFVGVDVKKIPQPDLMIAHYPVRSQQQIISKALVGWTNYLAMPFRKENNGEHWRKIYVQVKRSFSIDIDMMWEICATYLDKVAPENLAVKKGLVSIEESGFLIKYTSTNEINPLLNYFENTENLALAYRKLLEEKMNQ